ncbi:N-lysine methyltransferase KMT5A [Anabarilius grahami]|uniref:N-lysine methyltransferase KMT5A n=1 Tax=Anabarilius grahami TaxID=495550 RepID=A0A3N0XW65_ANAGA|nr:N-lysine methyltransferase KMT5A [Anabarilius grahami]
MKHSTPEERLEEVNRAKESTKAWTREARNWDYKEMVRRYPHRPSRLALLEELRQRKFFVANAPNQADLEPEEPSTSTAVVPTASGLSGAAGGCSEAAGVSSQAAGVSSQAAGGVLVSEDSSSEGSTTDASDRTWQRDQVQPTTGVRVKMLNMGLYQKFPAEEPMLTDFKGYLINTLQVTNCQQVIDNVSRMLRYIQPTGDKVTLDFLLKSTETKDFLTQLRRTDMGPATILNYIKNTIRFVQYLKTHLNLVAADPDFYRKCQAYIDLLTSLRKPVSKSNSKVTCKIRYERFIEGEKSLQECQAVLRKAKKDMLSVYGRMLEGDHVASEEKTMFRYYCEAILILGHFQRPGAVEGLTTTEWDARKNNGGKVCVAVSEHKTAAMQIAVFALTMEDAAILDAYYTWIRPECTRQDVDDGKRFFISTSGTKIRSATNDLCRLHAHYKLPNIKSQQVRRTVETDAAATFTEEQKASVAHYMAHSTAVANQHYRMKTLDSVVATSNLLSSLSRYSSDDSGEEVAQAEKRRRVEEEVSSPTSDFDVFLQAFPVGITGQPPNKTQRAKAGFPTDRVFYDKWRALQYSRREQHLLSKCSRCAPTAAKVAKFIEAEGWTANHPRPEDIIVKWRPLSRAQAQSDPAIIRGVTSQKWSGLAAKDFGGQKGVVATKAFGKGSILCDFHGKVITGAEGREIAEMQDELGHLFFFKHGSEEVCIDAETFPCECHPSLETKGRLITHSKKNYNVQPLHCVVKLQEGDRDVLLFQATKDISKDEKIRFNHSIKKRSFHGEEEELEWLDH